MSNPNKSYFDKYTIPVVKEIDKVNIYEFENGMDYEMTVSGKTINIDTIKEAQNKVLKNLKKDPNYYTNMLVNETIKMVGEYGSGKKPGVRETAKSAEAVKKDGKLPKADKQDAPFGLKDEVKGKYKSSGMEPAKSAKLNEGLDVHTINPASYLAAMDNNKEFIARVAKEVNRDEAKKNIVVRKLKQYAEKHDKDEEIQSKVKKAVKKLNDATPMRESEDIPSMYLGIGDYGFYDDKEQPYKGDFDFDYDEEEYDDFDEFIKKYPNQNWFQSDDFNRKFDYRGNKAAWDKYKDVYGGPYKLRKRRPMNESKGIPSEQLKKLKQLVSKLKEEGKKDLASALERLLSKGVEEGMDYTISNQETADKPGPGFYNQGTLSGFEEGMNENVNVKDSRKIRLTPTTKNQILTLVHEIVGEALVVPPNTPDSFIKQKSSAGIDVVVDKNPQTPGIQP
jgi:hypothetical protein